MEVKRVRSPRGPSLDREELLEVIAMEEHKKKAAWRGAARPEILLIGFLMALPLILFLFGGRWPSFTLSDNSSQTPHPISRTGTANISTATSAIRQDKLLGGLLSSAFDEQSCQSRYKSSLYRRQSPFSPSSYLIKRLRKYEAYHRKCGPNSRLYKKAIKQLNSGRNIATMECKYVVWIPCNGLGNRMLTLASTFLYALLTNRVLLIHTTKESENLFCEPFPRSSWVLPSDFPVRETYLFHKDAPQSYVNMLKNKVISNDLNVSAASLPAYIYLHVEQFRLKLEDNVFCRDDQLVLGKFNWMVLKSDSYFVPALFLMPSFEDELSKLFPEKESVFHHLGRYLFHPTNPVWGIIKRYYEAYLAKADERLGLQVRIFPEAPITFENMYDQILRCTKKESLLPEVSPIESSNSSSDETRVKAVLVTSLYAGYYEKIKSMYYENPTATGEIIAVYQPSHEEEQHTEAQNHNQKALAEMYLLSYSDKIVISAWSTFGYIAHGLAGVKPWILLRPGWMKKTADPPCVQAQSVEPCLHSPPILDCGAKRDVDPGSIVPYVKHCEDVSFGLKLFS
ncbi:galactoside 2-alpha-L-fucosyltransferase-like [Typha latifolia]|uniref:galactoside 2-alpha-L-fucosyltransferase-like n=1 Tax=Typha latifolia TaxID=4733 RepID=UPI003C2FA0D7